ncbi:MAG: hypothetical protein R3200_05045 [Xanthomonadales bacterium]|nr:hypothetical protein [Xanthomonadales bacterium]
MYCGECVDKLNAKPWSFASGTVERWPARAFGSLACAFFRRQRRQALRAGLLVGGPGEKH